MTTGLTLSLALLVRQVVHQNTRLLLWLLFMCFYSIFQIPSKRAMHLKTQQHKCASHWYEKPWHGNLMNWNRSLLAVLQSDDGRCGWIIKKPIAYEQTIQMEYSFCLAFRSSSFVFGSNIKKKQKILLYFSGEFITGHLHDKTHHIHTHTTKKIKKNCDGFTRRKSKCEKNA